MDQSLTHAAQDSEHDNGRETGPTSKSFSGNTDSENGDPTPDFGEIHNLIKSQQRIPFLGLENHSDAEYPEHIKQSSPVWDEDPATFTDIIRLLPEAVEGELRAVNDFVNTDGTVDVNAISAIEDIDLDQLSIDPGDVTNGDRLPKVSGYKDIVDPRRKALAALGCDVKFRWQVSTSSYTIINPKDAYWPAYRTFKEKGESDTIFGWVDTGDFGGRINIHIFFTDHTIERPGDDDTPIYVGFHTGYDFTGGRAMDLMLFGFDPKHNTRFYSLGARRSRRHVGDPNNPNHEREQGRTPIKDWWDREYDNLQTWTDELIEDIELATATTINFSEFNFSIEDFYSYLDIPNTYIGNTDNGIGAVKRAKRHSPNNTTFTMWTLFYSLADTLEEEFQGASHTSTQFKVYADIATNILRSPHPTIERVQDEYQREQEQVANENAGKRERALGQTKMDDIESITELPGVRTEDELDLVEKRDIAKDKQRNLFQYNENDDDDE
jgi:hypothetical protein